MMTASRSLKVLLTLSVILISEAVLSIATASPACDAAFMTTLRNRAWREAQREISTNQANIYKPDSVFAMSCFGAALSAVPTTFSQGPNTNATSNHMGSYMSNFPHGFVGATGSQQWNAACGQMNTVWTTSRCRNLTSAQFIALGTDPRASGCTNPTIPTTSTAGFDGVNLFLRNTDPLSLLTAGTACQAGIPTGVMIGTGSTYAEKVCPNPGCVPFLRSTGSGSSATNVLRCCDQNSTSATSPTRCEPG